jgi:hypothetical protein
MPEIQFLPGRFKDIHKKMYLFITHLFSFIFGISGSNPGLKTSYPD